MDDILSPVAAKEGTGPSAPLGTGLDVALYFGVFITFYVAVINIGTLLFQLINKAFPDPLAIRASSLVYYNDHIGNLIRFAIASVIVAFPLFMWLTAVVRRQIQQHPSKGRMRVRRTLTYFTMFVAGLVIMATLIGVINTFLRGDLEIRFALKALTILFLGASVFGYYYPDVRAKFNSS